MPAELVFVVVRAVDIGAKTRSGRDAYVTGSRAERVARHAAGIPQTHVLR